MHWDEILLWRFVDDISNVKQLLLVKNEKIIKRNNIYS